MNSLFLLVTLVLTPYTIGHARPQEKMTEGHEVSGKAGKKGATVDGEGPYECTFTTFTSPGVGEVTDPPVRVFPNRPGDPVPSEKPLQKNGVKWHVTRVDGKFQVEARDPDGKTILINTTPDGFPMGIQLPDKKINFSCQPPAEALKTACEAGHAIGKDGMKSDPLNEFERAAAPPRQKTRKVFIGVSCAACASWKNMVRGHLNLRGDQRIPPGVYTIIKDDVQYIVSVDQGSPTGRYPAVH